MRQMKAMLGILVAITVLVNGFMVLAAEGPGCSYGNHGSRKFSGRELQYSEKTGEHVVNLDNGMQAVCYIYMKYYVAKYYCMDCGSWLYVNETDTVHSLGCPRGSN